MQPRCVSVHTASGSGRASVAYDQLEAGLLLLGRELDWETKRGRGDVMAVYSRCRFLRERPRLAYRVECAGITAVTFLGGAHLSIG